jgi:hypothetical protein
MQKHRVVCLVKDCGKPSMGKQYCSKHLAVSERRKLPTEMRALIRSACCEAKCISGAGHDNGEQYCAQCKLPCLWKTMR